MCQTRFTFHGRREEREARKVHAPSLKNTAASNGESKTAPRRLKQNSEAFTGMLSRGNSFSRRLTVNDMTCSACCENNRVQKKNVKSE